MRPALAACLVALMLTGCAGPFEDDEARGDFERMDDFSVVLVGQGLLTAGPAAGAEEDGEAAPAATPPVQLADGLGTPEQPVGAGAEDGAATVPPAVETLVAAAINPASQVIQRQTAAANRGLAAANPRDAAPALQRLQRASRNLAARLQRTKSAPTAVQALALHCRRAANAARDLRAALLAGETEDAEAALLRYRAQATAANRVVAGLGLDGWPGDRRLFP